MGEEKDFLILLAVFIDRNDLFMSISKIGLDVRNVPFGNSNRELKNFINYYSNNDLL